MPLFTRKLKQSYPDAIASRFASWIINRKAPPDASGLRALEQERRRHLRQLLLVCVLYLGLGVALMALVPNWGVIIGLIVILFILPKVLLLGRDCIATPYLFQPAGEVANLMYEVDRACRQSALAKHYRQGIVNLGRPMLRVEALAIITVPRLDEKEWRQ